MKKLLFVVLASLALISVGAIYYQWSADLTLTHASTRSVGLVAVIEPTKFYYTPTPPTPGPTPTPIEATHHVYFPAIYAGPRSFPILWQVQIGHIPKPPYASCAFWCYFMAWGYEGGPDYLTQEISATVTGSWAQILYWEDLGLDEPEVGGCACVGWDAYKLEDPHCYKWCAFGRDSLRIEVE